MAFLTFNQQVLNQLNIFSTFKSNTELRSFSNYNCWALCKIYRYIHSYINICCHVRNKEWGNDPNNTVILSACHSLHFFWYMQKNNFNKFIFNSLSNTDSRARVISDMVFSICIFYNIITQQNVKKYFLLHKNILCTISLLKSSWLSLIIDM